MSRRFSAIRAGVFWLTLIMTVEISSHVLAQELLFAPPASYHRVELDAEYIFSWRHGQYDVVHLRGNASLVQGEVGVVGDEAVVLIQAVEGDANLKKLVTYFEGRPVTVRRQRKGQPHLSTGRVEDAVVDASWLGRFFTSETIHYRHVEQQQPLANPPILSRALAVLQPTERGGVRTVTFLQQLDEPQMLINPQTGQIQQVTPSVPDLNIQDSELLPNRPNNANRNGGALPSSSATESTTPRGVSQGNPNEGAQVLITGRDPTIDLNLQIDNNPANPNERILIGSGGVRVTITSPELNRIDAFKSDGQQEIVILADNVVAWQSPLGDGSDRWELYLEGNVIFAKDRRVIYADQMYYDANFQQGTILNADFYTPVQQFEGLVRMKADIIQQVDADNLTAYGAAFTSSRLAQPRYWLQSESIDLQRVDAVQTDPTTGSAVLDPSSGLPSITDEYIATSNRNRVYAGNVPVFAWPRFRANLNDPSLYLKRFRIGNDDVFGFQLLTSWDLYQLFGLRNRPEGTELLGSLDYLSDRGVAFGTESNYRRNSFFGIPGEVRGIYRSWFIDDDGLDNLGRGRTALVPEEDSRGRILWRHFHRLQSGTNVRAELGYLSDRNFLESFYEREWDTQKDATTGIWLERNLGSQSFNLTADVKINDFFAQTTWLPKLDHIVLGQALFTRLPVVHHGHSHFGYGRVRTPDTPTDAAELFDPLAWEADADGIRTGTRQQLDFPRQLGAVKVVPYVLGDLTYWQEDINGDDALRAYGQVGIRASLPFWRADPTVQSTLFNLNGLAHKVNLDVEAFYADASQDLDRFPLYDSLDDDAQEAFRRRFAFNTFGIMAGQNVPLLYDERFFALRSGFQSDVTAASNEIADDLSVVRFGVRQRWQTKRGIPGNERIIDWINFNVQTTLFPDADRDNFGSDFGLLDYDFKWFIGDRVSVVSDGYADFFGQGLRTVSLGVQTNRPGVSDAYIGIRSIEGPISSNVLSTAVTYRMSEKWGLRANSQIDFGETGTIGNALSFIYIGESFLWQFGVNADFSRSNIGFRFGFEPRFINRPRLFRPGGDPIPPASSRWLE